MRSPVDALRSMKRYVALVLGDDWEVRLWGDDVNPGSPFAKVGLAGPTVYSGPAPYVDAVLPMVVNCYPTPNDLVEVGIIAALEVEDLLFLGFRKGVDLGRSCRIPLYDYDGVPVEGVGSASDVRFEHDYMRVTDFSVDRLHDPTDDRLIVVVADVRVTWRRATHADPGNAVQSVKTEFDAVV